MSHPGKVALWFRAVRPFAYSASIIPVALGGLWAFGEGPINWINFVLAIIAGVLFHTGTNLVNDYYDFKKGVDREGTFGSSGGWGARCTGRRTTSSRVFSGQPS